ncbi:NERD domain-containing protein [Bacillus sp. FJAT-29790]|uniref:NERD domain-containing protein n=1 Tax=Bacillus sp. FJAT-29790 TaxID=1895002 RepID=UPI001C216AD9|nr:NERD domain-containing protein [Bacillus sp. FJAT-29790]MBU8878248.1 NERD domain-containing protein [Bacillus sp. FJAT-29790]
MLSIFLVLLMVSLLVWFRLNFASLKGLAGEKQVIKTLSALDPATYTILNDLYIPTENGKTSQIDHLVLSPKGIFVIETKNYTGWIIGKENSQYWKQVIYKRQERLYNPIWQNYGHIKALKHFLGEELTEQISLQSIIVFSNEATLKFTDSFNKASVINRKHLISTIQNYKEENDINPFKIIQIQRKLATLEVTDRKEQKQRAKQHVSQVKDQLKGKRQKAKNNECPRCGNLLVDRKGKHGTFKGCSNYPKCRFTALTKS